MFNAPDLFKQRLSEYIKEMNRYLRYMFNGHIAVALFFLIAAIAVYYQRWLETLPPDFPTASIIGIIFGILASYTPVRTLLQEPDLVFLIPAEHKMNPYFKRTLILSFVQQMLPTLFIVAALSPLYFQSFPDRGGKLYLLTFLVLLIFKVWNLIASWWMLKVRHNTVRRLDQFVRLLLNVLIFYFIIKGTLILAGVMTVLFVMLFLYDLYYSRQRVGIVWDILVNADLNRMHTFYRIANMFTDVPHLKNRVKKRKWLKFLTDHIAYGRRHTYDYLYRIAFIRSGDYLGMYLRLVAIGGILIFVIPNEWMKLIFAILFLYLTSFQMITLYRHFRMNMWLDLYPVEIEIRRKSVMRLLVNMTGIQLIIFISLFVIQGLFIWSLFTLLCGVLFVACFFSLYVRKKINAV